MAVLFTKGITYQSNITDSTAYKIKVGDDSYKIYLTSGELYQGDPKENIVLILEFTGSMFKVANGVARYLVDELAKRIQELELQRGGFVKLKQLVFPNDNDVSNAPVIDIYEQDTGGNSQFVRAGVARLIWRVSGRWAGRCRAAQLASIRQMSGQVSRGSAGEYQADERAGVAGLSSRVSG